VPAAESCPRMPMKGNQMSKNVTPIRQGASVNTEDMDDRWHEIVLPDAVKRVLGERQEALFDAQGMLHCIEQTVRNSIGMDGLHVTEESLLLVARAVSRVAQFVEKVAIDLDDAEFKIRAECLARLDTASAD
jgi:hypothetical protein